MSSFRQTHLLIFVLAFLAMLLAVPRLAQASPFRLIGYDSASVAGANAEFVYGESYGVLYSNPALMSLFGDQVGAEFMLYKPSVRVNLGTRPANADISLKFYDADITSLQAMDPPDRALATIELREDRENTHVSEPQVYLGTGFTHSFGLEGFRVGAMVMLPIVNSIEAKMHYFDEREAVLTNKIHLPRFGEWDAIVAGLVGVSYRPIKYISLGLGMQISAHMAMDIDIFIPEATVQDYMLLGGGASAYPRFRPIVGLQSEPVDWMSLGLTWRMESYVNVGATGKGQLWNFHEASGEVGDSTIPRRVLTKYNFILDYEPMELTGAVGFKYDTWKIQGGVTWNRWSEYMTIHGETPEEAAVFSRSNAGAPAINGDDYGWYDTISVTMNTSWRYVDWSEGKIGFGYHPSPVPTQKGRTNFADSNTWMLSMGNRFDFAIGEDWEFYAQIGLQFWQLIEKTTYKDPTQIRDEFPDHVQTIIERASIPAAQGLQTNNPGFPSYTVKGWMLVTSASLHYEF